MSSKQKGFCCTVISMFHADLYIRCRRSLQLIYGIPMKNNKFCENLAKMKRTDEKFYEIRTYATAWE